MLYFAPPRVVSRIIAFILAVIISLAGAKIMTTAFDKEEEINEETEQVSGEVTEPMQHYSYENAINVGAVVNAQGAVLCSLTDSVVIAAKNMQESVPLKDATVFMVALTVSKAVADGKTTLDGIAVCPASAAACQSYPLSSQILPIGKKMAVGDILKCMLYQNGASYAYTLAVHISGSAEAFTAEMNQYAQALGLTETVFMNCTGEGVSGTVSAYDFAVIMKHFLADTYLCSIFCSNDMMSFDGGNGIQIVVNNSFFENYCTASQAQNDGIAGGRVSRQNHLTWACLVFEKDGKTYVSAVFESESPFSDALMLYSAYVLCA